MDTEKPKSRIGRRQFLRLAAAGGMASLGLSHRSEAKMTEPTINLAVKYQMMQEKVSVLEKFQLLKTAGFQGVEITVDERDHIDAILEAVDQTGIVVHGLAHGSSDEYEEALNVCKKAGGDAVLVVAKLRPELSYTENYNLAHGFIQQAVPLAEKLGVRLLVENVRNSFLKEAEEMARFIDDLKSPLVGAYFDTGNTITWTDQSAEHWARVLGKRIVKLDIKDRGHIEFGDVRSSSADAIGTDGGEVHWENVRKELARVRFSGWATAEVKGGDRHRLKNMAQWMRQVLRIPNIHE